MLLKAGANPFLKDSVGSTPVDWDRLFNRRRFSYFDMMNEFCGDRGYFGRVEEF